MHLFSSLCLKYLHITCCNTSAPSNPQCVDLYIPHFWNGAKTGIIYIDIYIRAACWNFLGTCWERSLQRMSHSWGIFRVIEWLRLDGTLWVMELLAQAGWGEAEKCMEISEFWMSCRFRNVLCFTATSQRSFWCCIFTFYHFWYCCCLVIVSLIKSLLTKLLCTRTLWLTTVDIFLSFRCKAALSVFLGNFIYRFYIKYWSVYMQPCSSACVQKILNMAIPFPMQWSHFLRFVLMLWCTLEIVQVCDSLAAVCPAQGCAEAPGWSTVLNLDSDFGHRLCKHRTVLLWRTYGTILPFAVNSLHSTLKVQSKEVTQGTTYSTVVAAVSLLYVEKHCSCYRHICLRNWPLLVTLQEAWPVD